MSIRQLGLIIGISCMFATGVVNASGLGLNNNIARGLPPSQDQHIKVLASYAGDFRVLGRKDYLLDQEAQFSPMDLAVSSGILASKVYFPLIGVRQDNRFLTWNIKKLPIPAKRAKELVSNIHIIPANEQIAILLKQIRAGDLVKLQGDLVEVGNQKWTWRSSLSRDDVGEGACELMRVQSIQWVEKS